MLNVYLWERDRKSLSDEGLLKLHTFRSVHRAALDATIEALWDGWDRQMVVPTNDSVNKVIRAAAEFIDESTPHCPEREVALSLLLQVRACLYDAIAFAISQEDELKLLCLRSRETNDVLKAYHDIAWADVRRVGWLFEAAVMRLP